MEEDMSEDADGDAESFMNMKYIYGQGIATF